MKSIRILGVKGATTTYLLRVNVEEALRQLELNLLIEEISEIEQLMAYNISGIPALVVDGTVLFQKTLPDVAMIKQAVQSALYV